MTSVEGLFMSITEAVAVGPAGKSFEEVRVEDYIKAYQLKGRAPSPVLQEPADEFTRKALNMTPLFKPHVVSWTADVTKELKITDPKLLPAAQEFSLSTAAGEKYYAMSCMTQFESFSHEELRYHAYLSGNKQPPTPVKMDPFLQPTKGSPVPLIATPVEDKLENISARPGFERHSPEEFRIAYLLYRREMTSAELLQAQNPVPPTSLLTPPSITPTVSGSAPFSSLSSALSQPVYATTTPSVPKFTFGFK